MVLCKNWFHFQREMYIMQEEPNPNRNYLELAESDMPLNLIDLKKICVEAWPKSLLQSVQTYERTTGNV